MKNKIVFMFLIVMAILVIQFILPIFFYPMVESGKITEETYRLTFYILISFVQLIILINILKEGSYIDSTITYIGWVLVIWVIMDFIRVMNYPSAAMGTCVVSFFTGAFVFGISVVSIKKAVYNKWMGIFFAILGMLMMLRFPIFVDVLYFYLKIYVSYNAGIDIYYDTTIYINYFVMVMELFILYSIASENFNRRRYD